MLKKFTTGMRRETEILYQMYGKAICAIAYKYLRDNELAEDCLQEVMLRLAAILERIGEYGSPEVLRLISQLQETKRSTYSARIRERWGARKTKSRMRCL